MHMYLKAQSKGKAKMDLRWGDGVWLGIREELEEHIVGTDKGVIKCRSRRIKGSDKEKWEEKLLGGVRGTPWQPIPGRDSTRIGTSVEIREKAVVREENPEPEEEKEVTRKRLR